MFGGYAGKILRVNLTTRKITREDIPENVIRDYVGGVGLGTYYLTKEIDPTVDALGSQNKMIFASGPLCGIGLPAASRWSVVTKSPLGIWGEGLGGGFWGPELKFSGYDAVIMEGKASSPVYLYINNGFPELRSAEHLWGLDTYQTVNVVRNELMERWVRIACIGPAGESQCHLAGIISDPDAGAWRGGLGAVMGSKNLKAIAVRGEGEISVAHPDTLEEIVHDLLFEHFGKNSLITDFSEVGGMQVLTSLNLEGVLPSFNWRDGYFDTTENFDGKKVKETILLSKYGCMDCRVRCRGNVRVKDGPFAGTTGYRPQIDPACAFGPLSGVGELGAIIKNTIECNRLGMCGISAGASIAFAMECYEKGLINKTDTGGIDLSWGNSQGIYELLQLMARKEGFGKVLSDGVREAAKRIGGNSEDFAVHVKGLEPYTYDARGLWGMGLTFATSNRGACGVRQAMVNLDLGEKYSLGGGGTGGYHPALGITPEKYSQFKIDNKGQTLVLLQNIKSIIDSAIVCNLPWRRLTDLPELLPKVISAVTGCDMSMNQMLENGERIFNLQKMFNVKNGVKRKDDMLPRRFLEHPLRNGKLKGKVLENFEEMLSEYYTARGWDEDGIPQRETLDRLGIR